MTPFDSPLTILAIAVAGGVGSILCYLIDYSLPARVRARFPWGTVLVNLTGSFLLGAMSGAATTWLPEVWALTLGVGLMGGYTTFSAASLETLRLLLDRRFTAAVVYGFGQLIAGVTLAGLGYALLA